MPNLVKQGYFRRRVLHVQGSKGRFRRVAADMCDLNVAELLANTASEKVHVWIVVPGGKIQTVYIEDAAAAHTLYLAGHSTYCRS